MFKRVMSFAIFVCLFISGNVVLAQAATIRVPSDFTTIQAAIDAATAGDTVQVAAGTYSETIEFRGKAIRVVSEQGPQVTIIDAKPIGLPIAVVRFISGEDRQSVLSGFTIQNGNGYHGAGIRVDHSSPTITGNVIIFNNASEGGGGISVYFGSPLIQGNTIENNRVLGNSGEGGGGVSLMGASSAQLLDNAIAGNESFGNGAGVSLFAAGTPNVERNLIRNNNAHGQGGGVWISGYTNVSASDAGSARIANNDITRNMAQQQGAGIWAGVNSTLTNPPATPVIANNRITENSGPSTAAGIFLGPNIDAVVTQNLIVGNRGIGVYSVLAQGARGSFFINNTIAGNNVFAADTYNAISGIYLEGSDLSRVQLINNIIVAPAGQSALWCHARTPILQANDVVSNSSNISACSNQTALNGNIATDPLFVDAAAADYHLKTGSPAIDSGISSQAPLIDLDGMSRPQDGDGDGVFAADMGVYETPTIDRLPPVTSVILTPAPNSTGWNNTNVAVTLQANDNLSGVQSISYSLSGAQTSPQVSGSNPSTVSVSTEGRTTVGYFATDNAGNVEAPKSIDVKVDQTNPTISGMPAPGCSLWPANHKLVQVATVSAADSLSGLASLMVSATSNEPDSGAGDIVITGGTVQLRADRAPSGNGRIYTVTSTATDFAGNSVTTTATCSVSK